MFTLQDYAAPQTIEEAYRILNSKRNNTVLGGCAFLRLGSKKIGTGIDLSGLNLNYIKEDDKYIEIGAMTTFRDIETSPLLNRYFDGILPKSVKNIIGVQFRNIVTVGGTIYSRYGFSDLITALLSLDTEVLLFNGGRISLDEFLVKGSEKDILTKVFVKKDLRSASYQMMRNSASDYAILNAAVSNMNGNWRIAVGARPMRAEIAKEASEFLYKSKLNAKEIEYASELASKELSFGSNMRGSREYRKNICSVLVKRAVLEAIS